MKSVILDKGESYYTYLSKIFKSIDNEQLKYNWLITNCECYPHSEKTAKLFLEEYVWISGEELTNIILEEDIQFIWGVFSAFSQNISLEEVLKFDLPFADGNENLWIDDVKIQHPLADIEIVAWDSTLTLFMSNKDKLVSRFRNGFPLSEDLSKRNTKVNSEIAYIEEMFKTELIKRNINIDENILNIKFLIWRKLYSKRKKIVTDKDILRLIKRHIRFKIIFGNKS